MEEFLHIFIHDEWSFVDDELTKYECIILELKCDVDKWTYFELIDIIRDLGYR